ncbi:M50 family metallopeptidase [Stigmatella aurantiaca]|uniref:Membrane-associated Zn-dependent protease n=1 Tax=Stigmatella aurantiaca (strain DW4/3-1) TaxID=378806 RepID=Q093P5_STIAD|nr:M50 family metallopeptidase [Stigmatella aurantiaca]ADO71085.1 Peptidase, M50 [Stigmatella aurantiaca DW4/3-1]EAU66998.1 membrane-associated Zn-dependent protease [Stigmatella aurantiaca DW4/3-1]
MYALLALLALGLLLAVHELGHLVAARLLGLRVPRFSLGFGPPLLSFRLFGTEYIIAAIPLGASATIHGMNPHAMGREADAKSYSAQRPWRRVLVTLAGSLANYLLALGILFALYTSGTHVVVPLTVGTVVPGSEAARAQLLPGDRILSVDGQPTKNWSDFVAIIARSPGQERTLVVAREAQTRVVQVRPRADERGTGRIGVSQQYVFREHTGLEALAQALLHTRRVAIEGVNLLLRTVRGPDPLEEPASSVAVMRQSSDAASSGWDSFLRVLVTISVALALVHLLPIPGLDGGRLVFLAIESARGKPVSPRLETLIHTIGFLAITGAILAVAVAEIRRALPSSQTPPPVPEVLTPPAPAPDAGQAARREPAEDGGLLEPPAPVPPAPDAGTAAGPGPIPDGGPLPVDGGAANAG